ncbi:MAG: DNA repair protein RadC [Planctomycetes bacterium]|nr:DNA repair protein RadC [Planctomycetota bacterium]
MKDLPPSMRPRERVVAGEEDRLSTEDLLAILIREGLPGVPAQVLARRLLERAGGLAALSAMDVAELRRTPGIGAAKAALLRAAFLLARRLGGAGVVPGQPIGASADVHRHFAAQLRNRKEEHFLVVLLDSGHRVLREVEVSKGTLDSSLVHPREAFRAAVQASAAAVLLVHNHPSGDPTPSAEDLELTHRLCEAGRILGIRVLDHVVVAERGYVSFADEGLLPLGS